MNIDKTASSKAINIPARPAITRESILASSKAAAAKRNPESPVQSALSPTTVAVANAQTSKLPAGKKETAQKIISALAKIQQSTETTKF